MFAADSEGVSEFEDYERLVEAARLEPWAHLIALLGGEAALRCREMIALEWSDVDLRKRQVCIQRSDWKGHVGVPKGGRIRYIPLTVRLATDSAKTAISDDHWRYVMRTAHGLRGLARAQESEGLSFPQRCTL
jgi:integrase